MNQIEWSSLVSKGQCLCSQASYECKINDENITCLVSVHSATPNTFYGIHCDTVQCRYLTLIQGMTFLSLHDGIPYPSPRQVPLCHNNYSCFSNYQYCQCRRVRQVTTDVHQLPCQTFLLFIIILACGMNGHTDSKKIEC